MATILGLFANPLIIQLGLALLNAYLKGKELSEQERKLFIDLSAFLNRSGIKVAFNFYESDKRQDAEISNAWAKEKADQAKPKEDPPK